MKKEKKEELLDIVFGIKDSIMDYLILWIMKGDSYTKIKRRLTCIENMINSGIYFNF